MSEWTAGGNNVKFDKIGDRVKGRITGLQITDGLDLKNQPTRNRIIDLVTSDGEERRLYVKPGNMSINLAKALKEHGLDSPRVGDWIEVVWESTVPKPAPLSPMKVYPVNYTPATPGSSPAAADLV